MNGSKHSPLLSVALAASLVLARATSVGSEAPAAPEPSSAPAAAPVPTSAVSAGPRGQIQGSAQLRRNVPVIGAVVKATRNDDTSDLRLTTTDIRGAFRMDALPDGRYRVEVARDGFTTVVKDGIELRAPYRAVVEVTMAKVLAGSAGSTGSPQAGSPQAAGSTGSTGSPQAGSPQAGSPHGSTGSPQAGSPHGSTSSPQEASVSLRGVVRDKDGRVSGEVRVRLIRDDGSEDPREAVTTAQGEFAFDSVAPGGWRLEIKGAGQLPLRTTIELVKPTTLAAVLVSQPADFPPAIEDLMPREEPIPPH